MRARLIIYSLLALMATATLGALLTPASAYAGSWERVCCGAACGEDYCLGSGNKTCCKPGL